MVFDIRGRRKHVVKVVYAILALLMGASLFLVVGPVNIGALLGNSSSTSGQRRRSSKNRPNGSNASCSKNPNDEVLLLALTRARISAGNAASSKTTRPRGQPIVTPRRGQNSKRPAKPGTAT